MKDQLTEKYQQVLESNQEPKMYVGIYGTRKWILNGKLHRLDGPAIVYSDGRKEWFVNDIVHRLDGPAVEGPDGFKLWIVNGMYHRLDGPAVEYPDGSKEWWINGEEYSEVKFDEYVAKLKEIEKGSREAGANLDF